MLLILSVKIRLSTEGRLKFLAQACCYGLETPIYQ